nr:YidC/Oxa1 family membrane protein insertase [Hankyongella ginsenosidimutans]
MLMGITMYIQMKLNPQPTDPVQAKVFAFMPLFMTFIMAPFSAGLVLYWTTNNLLTIVQQRWLTFQHGTTPAPQA